MNPFLASMLTTPISVTSTKSSPVQINTIGDPNRSVRIWNSGSYPAYVAFASTSSEATANCVVPTAGNPQKVIGIPSGIVEVINIPEDAYLVAIAPSGNTTLEVTSGRGA